MQQWGAVIANNYASREFGVKRGDSLNEIKKKCPQIKLLLFHDIHHLLLLFPHIGNSFTLLTKFHYFSNKYLFRLCHVDVVNENGEIIPGKFTKEYHQRYKVTLDIYRKENFKILDIFRKYTKIVERASIDEAYLELTDVVNEEYKSQYSHILESNDIDITDQWMGKVIGGPFNPRNEADIKLLIASKIVHKIRSMLIFHYFLIIQT